MERISDKNGTGLIEKCVSSRIYPQIRGMREVAVKIMTGGFSKIDGQFSKLTNVTMQSPNARIVGGHSADKGPLGKNRVDNV